MNVAICGYAHTKFGKLDLLDIEALIGAVARDALIMRPGMKTKTKLPGFQMTFRG